MLFKDMYEKPIDRAIDAVVRASSTEHLANELDEYVVTPELLGHLNRFFDEYNDPDATGNGAWISGFFGSGKSHLLKILSVLLENQEVAGKQAIDYLLPKFDEDPSLAASIEAAMVKHPSESILFNIDIVAPNQGRTEAKALLAAFIKVFNKHCGYFDGDQQHIARLEYDLDREGKLELFRQEVEKLCNKPWEEVRRGALLHASNITAAFDTVCGNEPGTTENVVKYYKDTYQPDIHSFAVRVKEYIDAHEKGFRLNFFVDEVGQFIAQNADLMVNLQSVAEELNTVCGGDSWVIVTSQENMDDIVGEMRQRSANDFSKIQARFKIKMQLTSKDAKAVIKQRLLAKNKQAKDEIAAIYVKNHDDFFVLFDFADGSKRYKNYEDEQDFVDTYPFVPYQFDLFTTAMRGLSDFNAFTGRHHSTGARSMLGVFQQVGIELSRSNGSTEQQNLATFDAMFEGLRNDLKSEVYGQISIAENQLADKPMAIRVLKALLLVKYCKDFKATPGNLRVLLYGSFAENTADLEKRIKEALAELERQVYIRRAANSNCYEYLTDEEKDIEKEIRNTDVATTKINQTIADFFSDIVGAQKANYENGNFSYAYAYNLLIDGEAQRNSRNDLSLNIVTDAQEDSDTLGFGGIAAEPKTLMVVLQNANAFLNDVSLYEKTKTFVNTASTGGEVRRAIIADKRQANTGLYAKLRSDFEELLGNAKFAVGGVDITNEVNGAGKAAITSAMSILIRRSYTNLQQLGRNFTERDIQQTVLAPQASLETMLPEYVETVASRIGLLSGNGNVTVGGDGQMSLIAQFSKNEFGWPDTAVRNAVAVLYAANRVEIKKAGHSLDSSAVATVLGRNIDLDKLVVVKVDAIDPLRLAQIKSSYRALTGVNPTGSEAKAIAEDLTKYLGEELADYKASKTRANDYPFGAQYADNLTVLEGAHDSLASWQWISIQFPEKADALTKAKSELAAMKQFMEGSPTQRKWQEICEFKARELSDAIELKIPLLNEGDELNQALSLVDNPNCYSSREIPRASAVIKRAQDEIKACKDSLKRQAQAELNDYKESFENYKADVLQGDIKTKFDKVFANAEEQLGSENALYRIRDFVGTFKREHTEEILSLLTPQTGNSAEEGFSGTSSSDVTDQMAPIVTAGLSVVLSSVPYDKPTIETKEDIELYLSALKTKLEAELAAGHIVTR